MSVTGTAKGSDESRASRKLRLESKHHPLRARENLTRHVGVSRIEFLFSRTYPDRGIAHPLNDPSRGAPTATL